MKTSASAYQLDLPKLSNTNTSRVEGDSNLYYNNHHSSINSPNSFQNNTRPDRLSTFYSNSVISSSDLTSKQRNLKNLIFKFNHGDSSANLDNSRTQNSRFNIVTDELTIKTSRSPKTRKTFSKKLSSKNPFSPMKKPKETEDLFNSTLMSSTKGFDTKADGSYSHRSDTATTLLSMTGLNWTSRLKLHKPEQQNVRSYPSKRLIFQQRLESLKNKLLDNEEVNLDEYQDLEEWFESLNFKFNQVFFADTCEVFFYTTEFQSQFWRPSSREGGTLNKVMEFIVLYGGICSSQNDDIAILEPRRSRWSVPNCKQTKPNFSRHGHSAVAHYNRLVIFGGEKQFIRSIARDILDEVWMFDVRDQQFTKITTICYNRQIPARKYHAASICGDKMYVYGGIDEKSEYLSDVWELDLNTSYWREVEICNAELESGIAYHTMNYVADQYNRGLREGLYCFGGKDDEDSVLNKLKILSLNTRQPKWYYADIKGEPPLGRYNHSMEYHPSLNALLVYGGRSDLKSGFQEFKELKIFNLLSMSWSIVKVLGDKPDARYLHASTIYEDKMLIFGGLSNYKLKESHVKTIELNQEAVEKIKEHQERCERDANFFESPSINPQWEQNKANQILKMKLTSPVANRWQRTQETLGEHRDNPSYLPTPRKQTYAKMYSDALKSMVKSEIKSKAELEQEREQEIRRERQKKIDDVKAKILNKKPLDKPSKRDLEIQNVYRFLTKQQDEHGGRYAKKKVESIAST